MLIEKNDFSPQMRSLLSNGVDYIGIINKNGRLENSVCKDEIKLTGEKREMFCMTIRLQSLMQQDFEEEFGPVNYIVTEREKSKFVSIPIFSNTILAIVNKNLDHVEIIKKITNIVNQGLLLNDYHQEMLA